MDPYQGFEVGAEVELIEGPPVLEDSAIITVENKQDLPAWHHLHYIDESSSDESLDHRHVFSTSEVKNMETPKSMSEVKTECNNQLERKIFSPPEGLYMEPMLHSIQNDDQCVEWSDTYNSEHQDQTCSLEDTELSHMEVVPASNSLSPTRTTELYSEIMLTQEEDEAVVLGNYSFYNAKTQCAGTVKPWIRSYKCEKCGRQFGRMYNLESHICMKTALTRVNVDDIMSGNTPAMNNVDSRCEQSEESMNRLEKMCAEAQKELHNLQELYKREDQKAPLGSLVENQASFTHLDGLGMVPDNKVFKYRRPFTCDRCGRRFKRKFNLSFHVCCGDNNMSAPHNAIVIKPDNLLAADVLDQSDKTNSGQDIAPGKSESLDHANEGKIFKCQYCGKVYNRRASYGTHMRWHMKEKDLVSSVNKSLAAGNLEPLLTTINMTSVGLKKKTGPTFACEECGRIFNKQCSYSTHVLWHVKRRNSASALATPTVNQVVAGQEVKTQEAQVSSISAKHQGSDGTKAVPDTFVCPECGRVFYKRIAYANHSRWHVKERELALSVKAATQANAIGYQVKPLKGDSSKAVSQGYCYPIKHIHLGEQQDVYIDESRAVDNPVVECGQQRTSTEVPEFVFELEVGTESFHEDLLNKASEISETVVEVDETTSRTQTSSLTPTTEEPNERPVLVSQALPLKLLSRLLKRPKPPHRCRDCDTCFSQSWKLKFHQYKNTMRRSRCKKHRCDCGRSLVGLLHFLRHQLQHLRDTPFICAVCGKLLRGHRRLRAHSWVHPLVSQFQCRCGARFNQLPKYLWHSLLNKTRERRPKKKRPPKT